MGCGHRIGLLQQREAGIETAGFSYSRGGQGRCTTNLRPGACDTDALPFFPAANLPPVGMPFGSRLLSDISVMSVSLPRRVFQGNGYAKAPRGVGMCIVRPGRGPSLMIPPTGRARRNTRRWRSCHPTAARPTGRPRAARPCPRSSSTTPARWTAGATRRRGRTPRSGSTSRSAASP